MGHRFFSSGFRRVFFLLGLGVTVSVTAAEKVVLQLSYTHQFQFAGVYAAMSQGYFTDADLDVEVRVSSRERRPAPEVLSGRAHYGIGTASILLERLQGSPFVALASIFQHSPFVMITRADAGIKTPVDLIGRRIVLSEFDRYTEMRAMLYLEGLKPEQFVAVPDVWEENELFDGKADAGATYITDGPYEAEQAGFEFALIRPADYGVDFYGDILFTTEDELEENPARAQAMRQAILRGWEYALAHREEMIDWILTNLPENERSRGRTREWLRYEAAATAKLINADLVEIGHMNPGRWQRMAELAVAIGQAPSTDRVRGFVYRSGGRAGTPPWGRWLFGGLGIAVVVALAAILANRRLQSLVRRRTQELAVSEQRQREYFELAPAPIVIEDYTALAPRLAQFRADGVTDLRGHLHARADLVRELHREKRVVAANRLALVRTGYSSVSEMDRNLTELMTAQALDMFVEELVTIWEGKDRLTMEKVYRTRLGETVHALINWEVGRKDGKPDLANVRLVFTEVTQQKLAEQALRESEERYRQLIERAAGGVYRTSPDGQFLSANPALVRMFGFERAEAMIDFTKDSPLKSLYVEPARRAQFAERIEEDGEVHDFESEVSWPNGSTRWISENARAVRDEQGNLLYYEGFVTDITARRQLESEIARASKLEAVGILAGGIAHDFNNILTVILGNVTLLEMDTPPGSPTAARLLDAKRATLRARDLTLQLLTFAKGGEPVKSAIELPELLREWANFALHGAKARADFRFSSNLWRVNADKGQLGQVIQNLVINAVQAMPNGGLVTIGAMNAEILAGDPDATLPPGRYVCITVVDVGVGIAREHLAKIFDPYFTTKKQGSGLGLATAYSIVRKHGGHIKAESEQGRGTTFRIWLPAEAVASTSSSSDSAAARLQHRPRVLFMDDEAPIRAMASLFMERCGYDCDMAADGAEAVAKYDQAMTAGQKFEVVIMDLTVPGGMGGKEAMERLRRLDPAVRAIVSSGYSRDPVMANYRTHGFLEILPKPYGMDQLTKVLNSVLEPSNGQLHL